MRAVVLDGKGSVNMTELPDIVPDERDVVITPEAVGVCGTDLHLAHGDYPTGTFPVVPGHEFAGTVKAVGPAVRGFAVGDRVCVDPNVPCGTCELCMTGAVNLCASLEAIGVTTHGACAQEVRVPERVVFQLPATVDMATGALIEPLACVLHGLDRFGASVSGRRVLVYGAGSIGLLATAVLRAEEAARVEVIEPSAVRRDAAVEFGADRVYAPGERPGVQDVDLVVEASGHPSAVADALIRLGNRGTLLQMGVTSPTAVIDLRPYDLFDRELRIIGSQSLATAFPAAVRRIVELPGLAARMVTHTFPLSQYSDALAAAHSEGARKVQVLPLG
jgi:2-desacetyl-2-hydroxyethyl bacteriochlorophyllide A dehydrogenase